MRKSPDLDIPSALRKAGWIEHPELRHNWQWSKPPLPALYNLLDAWDLQSSLNKRKHCGSHSGPSKSLGV